MKYLLDTDTCIHIFRGSPSVIGGIQRFTGDDLAVSAITHYELLYGVQRCAPEKQADERRKVQEFIGQIHVLPFDSSMALHAAKIRSDLETQGCGIGPMDTLIGATALEANLTLVTGNLREFSRIPGLRCECWDQSNS